MVTICTQVHCSSQGTVVPCITYKNMYMYMYNVHTRTCWCTRTCKYTYMYMYVHMHVGYTIIMQCNWYWSSGDQTGGGGWAVSSLPVQTKGVVRAPHTQWLWCEWRRSTQNDPSTSGDTGDRGRGGGKGGRAMMLHVYFKSTVLVLKFVHL